MKTDKTVLLCIYKYVKLSNKHKKSSLQIGL